MQDALREGDKLFRTGGEGIQTAVEQADRAMHQAKREGKGPCVIN